MKLAEDFVECGSSLPSDDDMNNLAWGWVLDSLLDVKELSVPFFKDIIEYMHPYIEQPQCSKLLQKVALRYLDEEVIASHPKLDLCYIVFLRFLLKEQGLSNLPTRIHSLKESLENDLTLRVETEAVLTNLRCTAKEGRGPDWAGFEVALRSIFSEDTLEPRSRERRKELTSVLQDRSKVESDKQILRDLFGKYPLEELCRDLGRSVDDKRKSSQIRFLDQVAEDVETRVYRISQASKFPEPRGATTLLGSTPAPTQNDKKHTPVQEDGASGASGARVSQTKDVKLEMSLNMAEVEEIAKRITKEMREIVTETAKFTENVQHAASMPVLSADLSNQHIYNLAAPVNKIFFPMEQECVVVCPAKGSEGDPKGDEQAEDQRENTIAVDNRRVQSLERCTERDTQQTSLISSERVHARIEPGISNQVTALAKKRKVNYVEQLSEEHGNQSGATGGNTGCLHCPIMQNTFREGPIKYRLSREDMDPAVPRVLGNCNVVERQLRNIGLFKHGQTSHKQAALTSCGSNLPVAEGGNGELNAKCCFCGNSDGCQKSCQRCCVSIHEACDLELRSSQLEVDHCWYCFGCAETTAKEALRKALEGMKEAKQVLRNAEEELLAIQERQATFFSAKRESSREHYDSQNVGIRFSQGKLCERVRQAPDKTITSVDAKRGSAEGCSARPGGENRTGVLKSGIWTETRGSTLQDVVLKDPIRRSCRTMQDTLPTAPRASAASDEWNAVFGNGGPSEDISKEIVDGRESTSVPSLCFAQGLTPGDQHIGEFFRQEQSEAPTSSAHSVDPMISNAEDCLNKFGPDGLFSEFVKATNVSINRSEVPVDHGGQSSPSRSFFSSRNSEGEGEGHDGELEEVCEWNGAAGDKIKVAEQVAGAPSEIKSEPANVRVNQRLLEVYGERVKVPGVRRQSLPWTTSEKDALKEGVKMVCNDEKRGFQWKRILEYGAGKFHKTRTTADLKDKWRNLVRAGLK